MKFVILDPFSYRKSWSKFFCLLPAMLPACYLPNTSQILTKYLPDTYLLPTGYLPATYLLPTCYIPATYLLPTGYLPATYLLPTCYLPTTYLRRRLGKQKLGFALLVQFRPLPRVDHMGVGHLFRSDFL